MKKNITEYTPAFELFVTGPAPALKPFTTFLPLYVRSQIQLRGELFLAYITL